MTEKDAALSEETENDVEKNGEDEKEDWGELARTAFVAVLLAMLIRTFLFEPFNIPSSSMVPNLLVGDYLFVSKYSYGYSRYSFPFGLGGFEGRMMEGEPKRGDVVVFRLPSNPSVDFIKRVVGLPGETIQVVAGRLYINDKIVLRRPVGMTEYDAGKGERDRVMEYVETLPGRIEHTIYEESDEEPLDNTEKFTIPEGHYFMMGDNRDNSSDSRVMDLVGPVPFDNFVGRAEILFFSTNGYATFAEFWKWPWTIRYNRILDRIGNGDSLKVEDAELKEKE
jgi:signal peptidase I